MRQKAFLSASVAVSMRLVGGAGAHAADPVPAAHGGGEASAAHFPAGEQHAPGETNASHLAWQTGLGGLVVILAGGVWYVANREDNKRDWEEDPDGDRWYKKFGDPDEYTLDTNELLLNTTHAAAGHVFYQIGRAKGLGVPQSFGAAMGLSLLWEYGVEALEKVSINDVIYTPFAGMALGEASYQLGEWFAARKTVLGTVVSTVLLAPHLASDFILDSVGVDTGHAPPEQGLCAHRISCSAGFRGLMPEGGGGEMSFLTLGFDARLSRIPACSIPGDGVAAFCDGNAVRMSADVGLAGGEAPMSRAEAYALLCGLSWGAVRAADGNRMDGGGVFTGIASALEFGKEDRPEWRELQWVAHLLGPVVGAAWHGPNGRVTVEVRGYGDYAMVLPPSLSLHRAYLDEVRTKTPLEEQGYYHALGWTVQSELTAEFRGVELGVGYEHTALDSMDGLDRFQDDLDTDIPLSDGRSRTRAWLAAPTPWPSMWLATQWERVERDSRMGPFSDDFADSLVSLWLDVRY